MNKKFETFQYGRDKSQKHSMLSEYALSCANAETLRLSEVNYTIKELERIVNYSGVSLKAIIRTQILTPEFCVNYILSGDFIVLDSDSNIDALYILQYQPHIRASEFT